jgi:hypothetical protein
MAVLVPLVGFILGIVVATRPDRHNSRHGVWIILLSVVIFIVVLVLVLSTSRPAIVPG